MDCLLMRVSDGYRLNKPEPETVVINSMDDLDDICRKEDCELIIDTRAENWREKMPYIIIVDDHIDL